MEVPLAGGLRFPVSRMLFIDLTVTQHACYEWYP